MPNKHLYQNTYYNADSWVLLLLLNQDLMEQDPKNSRGFLKTIQLEDHCRYTCTEEKMSSLQCMPYKRALF